MIWTFQGKNTKVYINICKGSLHDGKEVCFFTFRYLCENINAQKINLQTIWRDFPFKTMKSTANLPLSLSISLVITGRYPIMSVVYRAGS